MAIAWNTELLDQMDFAWDVQFLPRLEGLPDDEYLWEPVDGCWSVRPDGGDGWTVDWARPEPSPPPFTTIAWRLLHIAIPIFGVRASNHFGDGSVSFGTVTVPGTVAGPFAEAPLAALVLHINREFLHHAAVVLLRDLYRDMHRSAGAAG
jgi:hypothetical protein